MLSAPNEREQWLHRFEVCFPKPLSFCLESHPFVLSETKWSVNPNLGTITISSVVLGRENLKYCIASLDAKTIFIDRHASAKIKT